MSQNSLHYFHFSDYCHHLCRHVYDNVSAGVRSGLVQEVVMLNLALYFPYRGRLFQFYEPCLMDVSYQLSPVNFPSESSPLPSPGIVLTLFFGYVTGSNQRLYPLCYVSLRTSVYEFLGIINLMSSATISTSAHNATLLLSLHVFFILIFYLKILVCANIICIIYAPGFFRGLECLTQPFILLTGVDGSSSTSHV